MSFGNNARTLSPDEIATAEHVDVDPALRITAIGDVHGMAHQLRRLLRRLCLDPSHERVVFVGDFVDKGPHSSLVCAIVRALCSERTLAQHADVLAFIFDVVVDHDPGNDCSAEELRLIDGLSSAESLRDIPTPLKDRYHRIRHEAPVEERLRWVYAAQGNHDFDARMNASIPEEHLLQFLESLPHVVHFKGSGIVAAHASIHTSRVSDEQEPVVDLDQQRKRTVLTQGMDQRGPYHVVVGHHGLVNMPVLKTWHTQIDTGASSGGGLTAARFDRALGDEDPDGAAVCRAMESKYSRTTVTEPVHETEAAVKATVEELEVPDDGRILAVGQVTMDDLRGLLQEHAFVPGRDRLVLVAGLDAQALLTEDVFAELDALAAVVLCGRRESHYVRKPSDAVGVPHDVLRRLGEMPHVLRCSRRGLYFLCGAVIPNEPLSSLEAWVAVNGAGLVQQSGRLAADKRLRPQNEFWGVHLKRCLKHTQYHTAAQRRHIPAAVMEDWTYHPEGESARPMHFVTAAAVVPPVLYRGVPLVTSVARTPGRSAVFISGPHNADVPSSSPLGTETAGWASSVFNIVRSDAMPVRTATVQCGATGRTFVSAQGIKDKDAAMFDELLETARFNPTIDHLVVIQTDGNMTTRDGWPIDAHLRKKFADFPDCLTLGGPTKEHPMLTFIPRHEVVVTCGSINPCVPIDEQLVGDIHSTHGLFFDPDLGCPVEQGGQNWAMEPQPESFGPWRVIFQHWCPGIEASPCGAALQVALPIKRDGALVVPSPTWRANKTPLWLSQLRQTLVAVCFDNAEPEVVSTVVKVERSQKGKLQGTWIRL